MKSLNSFEIPDEDLKYNYLYAWLSCLAIGLVAWFESGFVINAHFGFRMLMAFSFWTGFLHFVFFLFNWIIARKKIRFIFNNIHKIFFPIDTALIVTGSVTAYLQDEIFFYRMMLGIPVIALTGVLLLKLALTAGNK